MPTIISSQRHFWSITFYTFKILLVECTKGNVILNQCLLVGYNWKNKLSQHIDGSHQNTNQLPHRTLAFNCCPHVRWVLLTCSIFIKALSPRRPFLWRAHSLSQSSQVYWPCCCFRTGNNMPLFNLIHCLFDARTANKSINGFYFLSLN